MSRFGTGLFGAGAYDDGVSRFNAARREIAAALTAGDLIGYVDPPTTPAPGDCWALLQQMDAAGPPGIMLVTWRVLVVCGGDLIDAMRFMEKHVDVVIDLLAPVGYVQQVQPVMISGADMAAVEYRLVRE